MEEDYASMTVSELKELLKERDLKVSGKKSELVERLLDMPTNQQTNKPTNICWFVERLLVDGPTAFR